LRLRATDYVWRQKRYKLLINNSCKDFIQGKSYESGTDENEDKSTIQEEEDKDKESFEDDSYVEDELLSE